SFEDVQDLQRRNTLTVWRKLEHIVTSIVHRDRVDPSGGMLLEIGLPQEPAIGSHESVDLVSDLTLVESVPPFLTNQSQRPCQIRVFEDVAFTGRASFAIKRVGLEKRSGQTLVKARTERPVIRDQIADWKTFFGITNRGSEIVA